MLNPLPVQIAFQGGGAKLFALIAAAEEIKKLEQESKIRVTRVAGTSAGAIVAGLYAYGVAPSDIKSSFAELDIEECFPFSMRQARRVNRFVSRRGGARLGRFFARQARPFAIRQIEHNKPFARQAPIRKVLKALLKDKPTPYIPAFAVATDIQNRGMFAHAFQPGSNADPVEAILDSCAIPFFFRTVGHDSPYVDGAFATNLPSDLLTEGTSEFGQIVAISFVTSARESTRPQDYVGLAEALFDTAIESLVSRAKHHHEVFLIELDPSGISTFDFERAQALLQNDDERGTYEAAKKLTRENFEELIRGLPQERRLAGLRWNGLRKIFPYRRSDVAPEYTLVQVPYTEIGAVDSMQKELVERVGSRLLEKKWFPTPYDENQQRRRGRFDAVLRPEIAVANEAIYTFPFFLSYLRLNTWGVIPYARHRRVGIMLSSNHPGFAGLKHYEESYRKLGADLGAVPRKPRWIAPLLTSISKCEGRLISVKGYLFNEIVPLLIRQTDDENSQRLFIEHSEEVSDIVDHRENVNDKGKAGVTAAVPAGLNAFDFSKDVVIIDLAHKALIERQVKADYEILSIPHQLDIPVGIGFSLLMFPALDEERLWKEFLQIAHEKLSPAEMDLAEIGIELIKQ